MNKVRISKKMLDMFQNAGLRPTKQRLTLAKILFGRGNRHITAEQLHNEIILRNMKVSLATVYNTLHQFRNAGMLSEVIVEPGHTYFDTNMDDHQHFYHEQNKKLEDIPVADGDILKSIPSTPKGTRVKSVDVVVRISDVS
ncbi:MAG: Fur family transcriptional regulator [Pseudomonadota bacterium]|nr:Fur family transcriptional regulator [Pseudomonadota bacterium]